MAKAKSSKLDPHAERLTEWFLAGKTLAEARELLREHGQMGRDYPDVRANTVASFALGVALFAKFGTTGPAFDNALFGSILGITTTQIYGLLAVTALTSAFVFLRYRALLFSTFDPDVAAVSGVNVNRIEAGLMLSCGGDLTQCEDPYVQESQRQQKGPGCQTDE